MLKDFHVRLDEKLINALKSEAERNDLTLSELCRIKLSTSLDKTTISDKTAKRIERIEVNAEAVNNLLRCMYMQVFSGRKTKIVITEDILDLISTGEADFNNILAERFDK